ncbi:MAG: metalloregulator ArsR/SmtB family transcription factor [Thermoanaerobaculia bacterium]|nr:metalloregulator ArsR/SmtB family transcription factor [Thermoanaerobaculia bacterium]
MSDDVFRAEQLARLGKALAAPVRIRILDLLAQRPRTVERLAEAAGQSVANVSQHLRVLREARLVDAVREGVFISYKLASPAVGDLLVRLREIGEVQLAEMAAARSALAERTADVEQVDRTTLVRRLREGEAILIDVRPGDEYEAGHLPGALSMPLGELRRRIAELPRGTDIVAYCRGPYCTLAVEAVRVLVKSGRRAQRLEDGVAEWHKAGLRVAAGGSPAGKREARSRRS